MNRRALNDAQRRNDAHANGIDIAFLQQLAPVATVSPEVTMSAAAALLNPDLLASVSSAAFVPTDLSGLKLWLRADQGITLNGGNVSAWADQSGSGNDFVQATAAHQPPFNASDANLNSKPSLGPFWVDDVAWKGLTIGAGGTLNPPFTVFVAFYVATSHTFNAYVTGAGSSHADFYLDPAGGGGGKTHYAETRDLTDGITGPSARIAGAFQADTAGTDALYKNALTPVATGAQSTLPNFLDASRQLGTIISDGRFCIDGTLAEVVVYNRALTGGELSEVMNYLGARYGIAIGA